MFVLRKYIICSIFITSVIIASCGLIPGYYRDVEWVYFKPRSPLWAFTWSCRYLVLLLIFCIYIGIYVYVIVEYKKVAKKLNQNSKNKDEGMFKSTFGDSLWYKLGQCLLMFVFPDVGISAKLHGHDLTTDEDLKNIEKIKNDSYIPASFSTSGSSRTTINNNSSIRNPSITLPVPPAAVLNGQSANNNIHAFSRPATAVDLKKIQDLINDESMAKFEKRKSQILKQMKLIFIYPLAYSFIWVFQFVIQIIIWNEGENYTIPLWLKSTASFCQGFTCVFDVSAFLIREKPWRLSHPVEGYDIKQDLTSWRRRFCCLPMFKHYKNLPDKIAKLESSASTLSSPMLRNHTNENDDYEMGNDNGFNDSNISNDSSFRRTSELKHHSIDAYHRQVDCTSDFDESGDDSDGQGSSTEEDLMHFLNRGPPELIMKVNTPTAKKSKHTNVDWNLNVFTDKNESTQSKNLTNTNTNTNTNHNTNSNTNINTNKTNNNKTVIEKPNKKSFDDNVDPNSDNRGDRNTRKNKYKSYNNKDDSDDQSEDVDLMDFLKGGPMSNN